MGSKDKQPSLFEQKEKEELEAEVKFLVDRLSRHSDGLKRSTGISSNAMVVYSITGKKPSKNEFPGDVSDLAACFRARRLAPPHLAKKMLPLLKEYVKHIREKWSESWEEREGKLFEEILFGDD